MDRAGTSNPWWGLVVRLRALGTEVRVGALPDHAERLAEVGAIRADGATAPSTLLLDRSR